MYDGTIDELVQLLESNNSDSVYLDLGVVGELTVVITFGILSAVGIVTNAMMIIVLLRMEQTVFVTIILGLSFSDLVSSCISPFSIYQLLRWAHFDLPAFMCGLATTADIATTMVTVHQVMLLTLIRYRSIVHAFQEQWDITVKTCRVLVAISWTLSFTTFSIPLWFQTKATSAKNRVICTIDPDLAESWQVMGFVSLSLSIFIPSVTIVGLCLALIRFLAERKSETTVRRSRAVKEREKQVLLQLKMIVITYLVSYGINYAGAILLGTLRLKIAGLVLFLLYTVPVGILRFTECINPFMYCYASSDIRDGVSRLKHDVRALVKRIRTSPEPETTNPETATTSASVPNGV